MRPQPSGQHGAVKGAISVTGTFSDFSAQFEEEGAAARFAAELAEALANEGPGCVFARPLGMGGGAWVCAVLDAGADLAALSQRTGSLLQGRPAFDPEGEFNTPWRETTADIDDPAWCADSDGDLFVAYLG